MWPRLDHELLGLPRAVATLVYNIPASNASVTDVTVGKEASKKASAYTRKETTPTVPWKILD